MIKMRKLRNKATWLRSIFRGSKIRLHSHLEDVATRVKLPFKNFGQLVVFSAPDCACDNDVLSSGLMPILPIMMDAV